MNGERSLGYIRALAQFICQPQYKDVIELFGIINEPRSENYIGRDVLAAWYLEAYRIVKEVCGTGQGNGPYVSIHNGFESPANWVGLYPNADRMAMDMHPYLAFNDRQDPSPPSSRIALPCSIWGDMTNNSQQSFGLTTAGEWSLAINDCGQWVNGVDLGDRFGGTFAGSTGVGNCDTWNNWPAWSPAIRRGFLDLTLTSMDALQNYFFWTWKIGNSTRTGKVEAPFWSYSLGLAQGLVSREKNIRCMSDLLSHSWIPTDPRDAVGACARAGVVGNQYDGTPAPWQIGGTGAGNIPASNLAALAWPPAMIAEGGPVAALPRYTPTGPNPTLPGPTQPAGATSSIDFGNGLHNPQATGGAYVPIVGCTYPDAWATDVPRPNAAFCPAAAAGAPPADAPPVDADPAAPTPAPKL
jgi:glucan 1,3-beta-glucosidase